MTPLLLTLLFAVLPACATEDSANCAWDADTQGDGTGNSFIDLGGTAFYLPQLELGTALWCETPTTCVES